MFVDGVTLRELTERGESTETLDHQAMVFRYLVLEVVGL